ncbi:MAG: ribose-phosphate diphosphokinase [Patescibacteria group bacterium]|jgi:ribose-phosphate pyrophosphokinase
MKFFTTDQSHPLSQALESLIFLERGTQEFARYKNQEMYASSCSPVAGEDAVLFGSFSPPDVSLFQTLLAAHTLKKEGAKRVIAVLPFAAYMRHDKIKPGLSLTTAWVGAMAKASGIDVLLTIDIHSQHDQALVPVEIISLSTAALFADEITKRGWTDATLVAPDNGAVHRCEAVAQALKPTRPVAYFKKERTPDGVILHDLVGEVTKRCILIDDQLDTGATLLQAAQRLHEHGTEEILVIVTHGIFTGDAWKKLKNVGVKEMIVSDSLAPRTNEPWVSYVSVAPLLERALKQYAKVN